MDRRTLLASAAAGLGTLAGCAGPALPADLVDSCPAPPEGGAVDRTVCDGQRRGSPVFLRAEGETVSLPTGTVAFSLVNRSDDRVSYGPCFWTLYRHTADGWETVRPLRGNAIGAFLDAGETVELTLQVGQTGDERGNCAPRFAVEDLDPGRYQFGIEGATPDGTTALFLAPFRATE